jgi:tetratricopeptide (TPR) repeat protein
VERKLGQTAGDRWIESHLRPLVGLTGEAELRGDDRRTEAFAAWRQFFETIAEHGPLVLVAEDLHWSDDDFLDFIDYLVDWASDVPLLVVCTARPELLERRPAWGGGKPNALTISLSPLSNEEIGRLIGELLERPLLNAETRSALLARAGGNPLYAEQYARILRERGELAELPETVHGIVAARLDLLEPDEKALLQDAAVLGKAFSIAGLASVAGLDPRVVESRLHALERTEFVRRGRRSAEVHDTQYSFLHVLVRDVAYGQIPRAQRANKHRRVAEWIESLGRPEDHAEMLAHHYLQALELTQASGGDSSALVEPASRALGDAGDRAAALYAVDAAERFYDAAIRLRPEDDPERAELLFRRAAPVHQMVGGGDPERLMEARDALLGAGDKAKAAEAEMLIAESFRMQGRGELSDELAERAVGLLAEAPPSRSSAWVLARRAVRALLAGEYERAIEIGSRAYAFAEELGWAEGLSESLGAVGMARVGLGDRGGVEDAERSVEIAAEAGALGALARAHNSLSTVYQILGDLDAGYTSRLEGARIAERLESSETIRFFQGTLASFRYRRGDWEEALRMADAFIVEAGSSHYIAWQVFADRAEMRLGRGDAPGAVGDAESALAVGRDTGEPWPRYFDLAVSAHVLSATSQHEAATVIAHEFLEMLSRGVPLNFAAMNLPTFASAAVQLGLATELVDSLAGQLPTPWTDAARAYAQGDFAAAAVILRRTGSKPHEAEARLRTAEQLLGAGRRAEADEQVRRALDFYRSVGAIAYVSEGKRLLAC